MQEFNLPSLYIEAIIEIIAISCQPYAPDGIHSALD